MKTIKVTFCWGKLSGFGLGLSINSYMASADLLFWYVAIEY